MYEHVYDQWDVQTAMERKCMADDVRYDFRLMDDAANLMLLPGVG